MDIEQTETFLADEIFKVASMFNMYVDIYNSSSTYYTVMNISPAFFRAATLAFLENSTLRLCRLYEDNKDVVSIKSYLRLVETISSQYSSLHDLIYKEISACHDLLLAKERDLLSLRRLRDKSLAHNDKKMIHNDPFTSVGLTIGEYRSLINAGGLIVNNIRALFGRHKILFNPVDADDYEYIFIALTEFCSEHPDFFQRITDIKDTKEKAMLVEELQK